MCVCVSVCVRVFVCVHVSVCVCVCVCVRVRVRVCVPFSLGTPKLITPQLYLNSQAKIGRNNCSGKTKSTVKL